MSESVSRLISNVVSGMSNLSLYSKEHSAVLYFCDRSLKDILHLYKDGSVSLTLLGDSLLCNDSRIQERGLHISNFMKRLREKGIEKIIFREGLAAEELIKFIFEMVTREGVPAVSEHISLGVMEVRLRSGGGGGGVRKAIEDSMPKLDEIYHGVRKLKKLDMVGLEDIVSSYLATIKSEINVIDAVGSVKHHSEYTFAHTTNVSILSIYLAQNIGIKGELLRDVGLAGLLHDVGKAFVPSEIIDKEGKLDPAEWDEMKKHPVYGARYLSTTGDVPAIAVIGAYEHHLKYNGTGYPEPLMRGKKQHIISQILAVADFFDALRTNRSYRKALEIPAILGLLNEGSGKDFNPALVNAFIASSKGIIKQ